MITVYFLSSKSLGPFLSLTFAFLIYFSCLIDPSEKKYSLVFNKFFIFLGKISYSIYLSHVFVYWVLMQFYRFGLNWEIESTNLGNQIVLNDFDGAVFLGIFFLCTIIFSYYTNRYVENKFRLS